MIQARVRTADFWRALEQELEEEVELAAIEVKVDRSQLSDPSDIGALLAMTIEAKKNAAVDLKLAAQHYSPILQEVLKNFVEDGSQQTAPRQGVLDAYLARAKDIVVSNAGAGQSAYWISEEEQKNLPPRLRNVAKKVRSQARTQAQWSNEITKPQKNGKSDLDHFSGYLSWLHVDAAEQLVNKVQMTAGVWDVVRHLKAPGVIEEGKSSIVLGGVEVSLGATSPMARSESHLTLRQGDRRVAVGFDWNRRTNSSNDLLFARYDDTFNDGKGPLSGVHRYFGPRSESNFGLPLPNGIQSPDGTGLDPWSVAKRHLDHESFGRDPESVGLLAKVIATLQGGKQPQLVDGLLAGHKSKVATAVDEELPAALRAFDLAGQVQSLVTATQAESNGQVSLGDLDGTVRVGQTSKKSGLLPGREKRLIVEWSGYDQMTYGISLKALKEGRVDIHIAHDGKPQGHLAIDAKGKVVSRPEVKTLERFLDDLSAVVDQVNQNSGD